MALCIIAVICWRATKRPTNTADQGKVKRTEILPHTVDNTTLEIFLYTVRQNVLQLSNFIGRKSRSRNDETIPINAGSVVKSGQQYSDLCGAVGRMFSVWRWLKFEPRPSSHDGRRWALHRCMGGFVWARNSGDKTSWYWFTAKWPLFS